MCTATLHPFESAGLGLSPFKFTGMSEAVYQACPGAPVQAAGMCDYCGTCIRYCCHIESQDGRQFKVGTDCVAKLGRADNTLVSVVEREKKKIEAKQRADRKEKKFAPERARIEAARLLIEAVRPLLAAKPHPIASLANCGNTLADYVDYLNKWGGHSGLLRMASYIDAARAESEAQQ